MQHFRVGALHWTRPQHNNFALGIPTCWYLKTRKFALPLTPNLKFAFPPRPNPNASQWNIGCVGFQTQISHVGHVHFIFCVLISFALGTPFPVEYGLNSKAHIPLQRESLKQCPTRAYDAQHETHGTRDVGLHWACIFQVICVNFIRVGYPTKTRSLVEYGLKTPPPPPPYEQSCLASWHFKALSRLGAEGGRIVSSSPRSGWLSGSLSPGSRSWMAVNHPGLSPCKNSLVQPGVTRVYQPELARGDAESHMIGGRGGGGVVGSGCHIEEGFGRDRGMERNGT